jgi:hypothetical protein
MLDYFTIFNKRGIVLFSYPQAKKLPGAPVDRLIKDVLLEERSGEDSYSLDSYSLKWTFANEFDLIFVVCLFLSHLCSPLPLHLSLPILVRLILPLPIPILSSLWLLAILNPKYMSCSSIFPRLSVLSTISLYVTY